MENIAYLAALNEMKKDMQTNPIRVFSGYGKTCKRNMLNFLNCCSGLQGWGKDLGLNQCNPEEKALALKRDKGQCHFVGTYCSERAPIFGTCLTKRSTYCCFNSKLARIVQEAGRAQLGLSFGVAQHPNCRGFTVEELQKIDFSKIDMSELFTDLFDKARDKMNKSFPKQLQNQMPIMQQQNNSSNLSY
ncbi:MAG: conjugal transfer protein TraN [Candidatus Rickettsia vulgarisii]